MEGHIVSIEDQRIFDGRVVIENGKIVRVEEVDHPVPDQYILPGFVDAHVHIESSLCIPSEFARLAVTHGTVATVSDPHEIGNVLGIEGVRFMIENAAQVPFKIFFGAPSCVPATIFETAGAQITVDEIRELFEKEGLLYLSEMMNYPGVIYNDPDVMAKLAIAKELGRPIDGHAPAVRGEDLKKYAAAGISTDHESFEYDEALEKLNLGMKILIREGSAAKNFDALAPLIDTHHESIMFCSDDKHPDYLEKSHIDELVRRATARGTDIMKALQCACINPVKHYNLPVGLLQPGDPADFIVVDNLNDLRVLRTYIDGQLVAQEGTSHIKPVAATPCNQFNIGPITADALSLTPTGDRVRVIEAIEGQLITKSTETSYPPTDALKLVAVNRYNQAPPAIAYIRGFNLKQGALASTVAHDSHNIVAVGCDDESLTQAINALIESKGGLAATYQDTTEVLPLPVAGLMSLDDAKTVSTKYQHLNAIAHKMGTTMDAPFMTLSFVCLLVIPSLKLSDKGLFDGDTFAFTPLFRGSDISARISSD